MAVHRAYDRAVAAPTQRGGLGLLAAIAFLIVAFESSPVGLMSALAADLDVSEAAIGGLVTIYAAIAALSTIPLMRLLVRIPRHVRLTATMVMLAFGALICAAAPNIETLYAGRMLTAVAHGVVWATLPAAAAAIADPARPGRATAVVFGGASIGVVVGNPALRTLSTLVGWRAAFVLIALVAIALAVVTARARLEGTHTVSNASVAVGRRRWVAPLVVCAWAIVAILGHFAAYTFFEPMISERGWSPAAVSTLLLLLGLTGMLGTVVAGRFFDRAPRGTILASVGGLLIGTVLLSLTHSRPLDIVAVAIWGTAAGMLSPSCQSMVTTVATGFEDLAASVYVVSFQSGIAAGSALGTLVVTLVGTVAVAPIAALVLAGAGALVLATAPMVLRARAAARPTAPEAEPAEVALAC